MKRGRELAFMESQELCTFLIDLKYFVYYELDGDYGADEDISKVYDGARRILERQGIINYVLLEKDQMDFLKTCPCAKCKLNVRCSKCDSVTPFDPLNAKGPYRMACRKNSHMCLKCKVNS